MARVTHYQDDKEWVIKLIHNAQVAHSRPPTIRDLADELGVGLATMHSYLTKMVEEGLIDRKRGHHRSLTVTDVGMSLISA